MTSDLKKKMYLPLFIDKTPTQMGRVVFSGPRASSRQSWDEAEVS